MKYQLKTQSILGLKVNALEDLDATIDALFSRIERGEDPRLLEDLCPYFGVVWPAALALTQMLQAMGPSLKGARVLEVGCGLALPSLMAAKLGATVTATDYHPDVPEFLQGNLKANNLHVEYKRLDWKQLETIEELVPHRGQGFDWVLGSDVLYERDHPGAVAEALTLLAGKHGRIIIADPLRPYLQSFIKEMESRRWRSDELVMNVVGPKGPQDVLVLPFNRASAN
jgi:predicted nicotinamide N-methyase